MKKFLFAILLSLFLISQALVSPAFAAGTVTQSLSVFRDPANPLGVSILTSTIVVTINWVGDSGNGSVPSTAIIGTDTGTMSVWGWYLHSIETVPGSPSPTNNYTITITDANGVDLLQGNCSASLNSTTAAINWAAKTLPIFPKVTSPLTFNLSVNVVNSAQGKAILTFVPIY